MLIQVDGFQSFYSDFCLFREGSGGETSRTAGLHAIGPNKSLSVFNEPDVVTCILCQEEERISFSGKAMVYSTFVQR